MEYTTHTFGVKITGKIIAIEEADLFADISKYDMILRDKMTSSYNGNDCFACDIEMTDVNKEYYEINGWKLKCLYFPGNWHGQSGSVILINKLGGEVHIHGCNQQFYSNNYTSMITECLSVYVKFALSTNCFVHSLGNLEYSIKDKSSLKDIKDAITSVDRYIQRYENLSKQIDDQIIPEEEKEKSKSLLSEKVIEQVNKYFGCNISKIQ